MFQVFSMTFSLVVLTLTVREMYRYFKETSDY